MHAFATQSRPRQREQRSSKPLVLSLLLISLAAVVFGGVNYIDRTQPSPPDAFVPEGTHIMGDASAPITLVMFGDFRCAECAELARDLVPDIQNSFGEAGLVRVVFRHYPILGRDSERAAVAAECAGEQGRFWEMHDVLFSWQGSTNPDFYTNEVLRQLGLGVRARPQEFTDCLVNSSTLAKVERDTAFAYSLGIRQVPAVYVNGESAGAVVDRTRILSLIAAEAKGL